MKMTLTQEKYVLFDDEDLDKVSQYRWMRALPDLNLLFTTQQVVTTSCFFLDRHS